MVMFIPKEDAGANAGLRQRQNKVRPMIEKNVNENARKVAIITGVS
jgi:hypothetical protein